MRTLFSGEIATLSGAGVGIYVESESQDADGTWQAHSTLGGTNWTTAFRYRGDIDTPVVSGVLELARADRLLSMAPFVTGSTINRNAAAAYAPFLDAHRRIRVKTAVVAAGVVPVSGDYRYVFDGYIDKVGIGGRDENSIVVECRDLGALLLSTQIEVIREYGSDAGTAVETVMQSILDDNFGAGVITLSTPATPNWQLHKYSQQKESVMEAIRKLAQQIGYDVRYVYNAANVLTLTFYAPARTKVVSDYTIGPAVYDDVQSLEISDADVRNAWTVRFIDRATGVLTTLTATDPTSIARFGRKPAGIDEGFSSNIDSATEGNKLINAALADTANPKADETIRLMYWPIVDLADLATFSANGEHYDTDQQRAVVGYEHDLRDGDGTTTLITRGSPSGGYLTWLAVARGAANVGPSLNVLDTPGVTEALAHSIFYQGTWDTIRYSVNGGAETSPAASPISIVPAAPGGQDQQITFRATKDGQSITQTILVKAQTGGAVEGAQVLLDPQLYNGATGLGIYDNGASGKVHVTTVADATAPNASGNTVHIATDANSLVAPATSPGYGGFTWAIVADAGTAQVGKYHRGAKIAITLRLKIPVGYQINFATNAIGTGGGLTWNSPQAGTGNWFDYKATLIIGTAGTFSSTGYFYLTRPAGQDNIAVAWDMAYASWKDMNQVNQSVVWPTADLILKSKTRATAAYYITGAAAPGMPPIAKYSITEFLAGNDTEVTAGFVAWTAGTFYTCTRHAFYDKILRLQVQDAAGNLSDIVEVTVSSRADALEDVAGRIDHSVPMNVGFVPFAYGGDDAGGVLELAGKKFIDGSAIDASRRPIQLYRGAVYEPAVNLFKNGDSAVNVGQTTALNFTHGDQLDGNKRVIAINRAGVTSEPVGNMFRNNDAATNVNPTSSRAFVDPSAVGGGGTGKVTTVFRLGVDEPVNNLIKIGDTLGAVVASTLTLNSSGAQQLSLQGSPTNVLQIFVGTTSVAGVHGSMVSSGYQFISYNAYQNTAGTDSWTQALGSNPSGLFEVRPDGISHFSAVAGKAVGTKATFWGSPTAYFAAGNIGGIGQLRMGNQAGSNGVAGDVISARGTTTGAYYYGNSTSAYTYFDGTWLNLGADIVGLVMGNYHTGIVGQYDATKYRAIYSIGVGYTPPAGGTALTGMYGLTFLYDATSGGNNISGLNVGHSLGLVDLGVIRCLMGTNGFWTSGHVSAGGDATIQGKIWQKGEGTIIRRVASIIISSSAPTSGDSAPDGTLWLQT